MGDNIHIGDRVKYSDYSTRHLRDSYLSIGGPKRETYKRFYDEACAMRGTVTKLCANRQGYLYAEIQWDNGANSQTSFGSIAKV
jgi:hypothetical protein